MAFRAGLIPWLCLFILVGVLSGWRDEYRLAGAGADSTSSAMGQERFSARNIVRIAILSPRDLSVVAPTFTIDFQVAIRTQRWLMQCIQQYPWDSFALTTRRLIRAPEAAFTHCSI